jgi:hypothetical protein
LGDRTARTKGLEAGKFIVRLNKQFGDFAEISPACVDAEVSPCGECGAGRRNGIIDIVDIGLVDCDCLAGTLLSLAWLLSYPGLRLPGCRGRRHRKSSCWTIRGTMQRVELALADIGNRGVCR